MVLSLFGRSAYNKKTKIERIWSYLDNGNGQSNSSKHTDDILSISIGQTQMMEVRSVDGASSGPMHLA